MRLQHLLKETITDKQRQRDAAAARKIVNFVMKKYGLVEDYVTVAKVGSELRVDIDGTLNVPKGRTSLGVMFNLIKGSFMLTTGSMLTDLTGAPLLIEHSVFLDSKHLTSLAGLENTTIGKMLDMTESGIKTLAGIHKTHKNLKAKEVYLSDEVTNILGLAAIPGIDSVVIAPDITRFNVSHHDIHQFQEELLDAGYKAQAKL